MKTIKVNDIEYKIRFGYRALACSNALKEAVKVQKMLTETSERREKLEREYEEKKKQMDAFPEHYKNEELEPLDDGTEEYVDMLTAMMDIVPKLILAGLQKTEEFACDYNDEADVKEKLNKVIDLLDDYTEQEDTEDISEMFGSLLDELFNCGFLSEKSKKLEKAMEQTDSTVTPKDHKQPQN